jgi:hypothetical protein
MSIAPVFREYADELAELHDGSVSLFVTLPRFRAMVQSPMLRERLSTVERAVGDHLAVLDRVLVVVQPPRDRHDGKLTTSLFDSLHDIQRESTSAARDARIRSTVEMAHLALVGACGFTIATARAAGAYLHSDVLSSALDRLRALSDTHMSLPAPVSPVLTSSLALAVVA